jgi:hypothetical protein
MSVRLPLVMDPPPDKQPPAPRFYKRRALHDRLWRGDVPRRPGSRAGIKKIVAAAAKLPQHLI